VECVCLCVFVCACVCRVFMYLCEMSVVCVNERCFCGFFVCVMCV
jgi:hypothetical protein